MFCSCTTIAELLVSCGVKVVSPCYCRWRNNLARSANLPEGLSILPMFFLYFVIFLVVTPGATLAQKPMDRSSPKFQDW